MYPCNESDPVDACVSIIVSIHDMMQPINIPQENSLLTP
jgi:hypothetical protein